MKGMKLRAILHRTSLQLCRFLDASNDETIRTLSWLASKKRQGAKSREVWHRPCSESYGDLKLAENSMIGVRWAGCDLQISAQARSGPCKGHLGVVSERINGRSARYRTRSDREGSLPALSPRIPSERSRRSRQA